MNNNSETKVFLGIIAVTIVILAGAIFLFSRPPKAIPSEKLIPQNVLGIGPSEPKATLVEFADFECPACGSAHPTVKRIVEKYKDEVRYVFRHFPLDQHKNARQAAQAAEAAAAQGKFWEMQDLLFQNQSDLSLENLKKLGAQLGLNMEQFEKDLADGKYKDKIQQDVNDGLSLGVNSTPTFFLDGKKLNLFNFNQLETEIEKAIN